MFSFRVAFLTLLAGLLITALVPLGVLWAWQRWGALSMTHASAQAVTVVVWLQCLVFLAFAVLRGLQLRRARHEQRKIVQQLQAIGFGICRTWSTRRTLRWPKLRKNAPICCATWR
jgi:ABC-type uncharacterized transport system permease subunit